MSNNFFDVAEVDLLTTYTSWRGKVLKMKHKRTILFCCFVLAVGLSACQNNEIPQGKIVHPITRFIAYNTIVQTDHDVFLYEGGDSQNFRLWIDSCPIIEEVDFDISDHWNYKVIFCDTEDIIFDNSIYYIPHTATTHVVYINEEDNIIQYDNVAYSVKPPDVGRLSFYDCIRAFLIDK